MLAQKPPMGWNTWNTFGTKINESLLLEITDKMVTDGYRDAGYEYVIIDDGWSLKERVDGKLVANPELFPHGIKYLSDYIHSKGLKFGMYSCAGVLTCAGFPSSYGHEFEDAKQFAEWGVDYLKYDFCNFPASADAKNAYLTMAMALRNSGRDILFAACNWGRENPAQWMRSHGAHTYRSDTDIKDSAKSYMEIFKNQFQNMEGNAPGCYNDIDMLIVGMHGIGVTSIDGCNDEQYQQHFAMWAFLGSPLIIGADIRNIDETCKNTLQNFGLLSINQDDECRPPFFVNKHEIVDNNCIIMFRFLSDNRFAVAVFKMDRHNDPLISFDDIGVHDGSEKSIHLTDAFTGEDVGIFKDGYRVHLGENNFKIYIGELV